jgi:diguanylate cyclase (GGDEF)-like protein
VLPDCDASTAEQILNDLRVRFASLNFNHEGKDFSCSISIGLACITQFPECNGAELLLAADAALYAAKKGGRNKVRIAPAILANKERIQ